MEFVDGVNLRQAMKAGRFTPEQALAIVPAVCEALQYAHDHGIVHRDIKPENLLLDKMGRVKIADFGIAKMLSVESPDAGTQETQAGTPQYMAPEQKEHGRTDHRADIYSLGVVLYELLTGELPAEKLRPPLFHASEEWVNARLDEIVLRALARTPELRYQTAADFRTQLQAAATRARNAKDATPKKSWMRIGKITAGVIVAAALGFGVAMLLPTPAQDRTAPGRLDGAPAQKAVNKIPVAVVCAESYVGDLGIYLDALGSVRPPPTPSAEGQDDRQIPILFLIPENYVQQVFQKLRAKLPLPVEAYDREMKKVGLGFLTGMDNQIDAASGTVQCRATITAEGDAVLLPNKFLNVRLLMETKHGVTLAPANAFRQNGLTYFACVVGQNHRVEVRPVTLGVVEAGVTEIKGGLSPGESVILDPPATLKGGDTIRCQPAPAASPARPAPPAAKEAAAIPLTEADPPSEKTPPPDVDSKPEPAVESPPAASASPTSRTASTPSTPSVPSTTQALRRESLVIKLRQAAEAARLREAEYNSGVADKSEVLAAEETRDLLQAQLDGHPARMLSIRLKTAQKQAAMVEARYKVGEVDQSELLAAKEKVDVLEAEAKGDAVQAAKVRLSAAEGQLQIAEARSRIGEIPFLELDAARNAVELRRAELREAKAAQAKAAKPGRRMLNK